MKHVKSKNMNRVADELLGYSLRLATPLRLALTK